MPKNYQHCDFSYLLKPEPPADQSATAPTKTKPKTESADELKRQELLSNPDTWLVYSAKHRKLHHKSALSCISQIQTSHLRALHEFPYDDPKMTLCSLCEKKILTQLCLPATSITLIQLENTLLRLGVISRQVLLKLAVLYHMEFLSVFSSEITFKIRNQPDVWKIRRDTSTNDSSLVLLHNDYSMDPTSYERRLSSKSFHVQARSDKFDSLVAISARYDWQHHIVYLKKLEREKRAGFLQSVHNYERVFSFPFVAYRIVDCDQKFTELLSHNRISAIELKRPEKGRDSSVYAIRRFLVPFWQQRRFASACESLKDYTLDKDEFRDYVDNCVKLIRQKQKQNRRIKDD